MSFMQHPHFLRNVLRADAATCLVAGLVMALGARPVSLLTDVPADPLFYAGLSLLPVAAFILWVATRLDIPASGVWLIIVGNAAWVAASLWLMMGGSIGPNAFGLIFIALQAATVAVLTKLEYVGVRRLAA